MCNFKLDHFLQCLVHSRCSIDVCWIEILLDSVLGGNIMFATCIYFSPQRRVEEVCCGHVGRKIPKGGGDHDSKYKVTELSLWSHISAAWVRMRNYSAAGTAFFFFSFSSCLLFLSMAPSWLGLTNHERNISPLHAVHFGCCRKSRFAHGLFPLFLLPVPNPLCSHKGIVCKSGK